MRTALIIPTWKAERHLDRLIPAIQALDPAPEKVLVVDSSSPDGTVGRCREAGFLVHVIESSAFGHGRTRNLAARLVGEVDVLLFMTQDALPVDRDLVARLAAAFRDPEVGHAFARQIPHRDATLAAAFARRFNYPDHSFERDGTDLERLGVSACFTSNSCAAYRREVFFSLGGFDEDVPVSEDSLFVARMLRAGYRLRYVAEARVAHSHNYTLREEFSRYFDIGVTHHQTPWYVELAQGVESRGRAFVGAELRALWKARPVEIPLALSRNAVRWLGYRAGRHHHLLPRGWRMRLSAQPQYWRTRSA